MEITGLDVKIEKARCASEFSERMKGYDYGLFYYLSEVKLIPFQEKAVLHLDQLIEARLFSEDKELHIFENEIEWQAVLVREIGQAEYIEEWRPLSREFQEAGKQLGVRRYLSYDEDGQAFTAFTRLCAVKGGD